MPDLNVPYIAQNFEFDCWYASLRMIVKFRNGPGAEPMGYETAELAGMTAQSARDSKRIELVQSGLQSGSYGYRKELAKIPRRGLNANEFIPMAQRNGLVAPMMPGGGGFTYNQYDGLLSVHGPLWCAVGYGHIVVLKGTVLGGLLVHDPQGGANQPYPVANFNNLIAWDTPNSIMFLPGVPNAGAFN